MKVILSIAQMRKRFNIKYLENGERDNVGVSGGGQAR